MFLNPSPTTGHTCLMKFFQMRQCLLKAMLAEGKHLPEDYIKAAINKLKAAGKYNGSKTDADVAAIANRFKPKFHTNSWMLSQESQLLRLTVRALMRTKSR